MGMFEDFDGFGDIDSADFVKFGTVEELQKNKTINRKIVSKWISVFLNKQGEPYAIEMSCKHHGANLAEGKIEKDVVTCPRHFWKYNIVTGKAYTEYSPNLRQHAVRIQDGTLYVSVRPKL